MKINDYEINLSEAELSDIFQNKTITFNMIGADFQGYENLKEGDKKALKHLIKAAEIINDISLEQDHHLNLAQKKALEEASKTNSHAALALRFFNSYNGVEGSNGIDPEPIELFKGITGLPGRNFYPTDLTPQEFHTILKKMLKEGKVEAVQNILSYRTMVRREGDELKGIDYVDYFKPQFQEIAEQLKIAAASVTSHTFKDYLLAQAAALETADPKLDAKADIIWAKMQDTDLEFTLGRENYDDGITPTVFDDAELAQMLEANHISVEPKDMLGIRVGIINPEGTELLLKFKDLMPQMARKMPLSDQYEQKIITNNDFNQTMVDVDLASLSGDYRQFRPHITTAQNLPNNNKLSLTMGGGRRNVYHRQVRKTGDVELEQAILKALVAPHLHAFYNREADHLFVIGHENAHSFGPDAGYQGAVGIYQHTIEELKADIASLALMPEYYHAGVITKQELHEIYTTLVAMRLFLKAQPQLSAPHRIAELMILNYLITHGAVFMNEDQKVDINFEKFQSAAYAMLEDTIKVQLSKSPAKAKAFIDQYSTWGEISKMAAAVHQKLGIKPYKELKINL